MMNYVSAQELGAQAEGVWAKLEADDEVVITRDGKPFALLVHTDPEGLEENLRAFSGGTPRPHPRRDAR